MLRVGFYQFKPEFGRIDYNLNRIIKTLNDIQADIIVLPELAFTGYFFKDRAELAALSEQVNKSAIVESLISLCKQNDFYLISGFAEKARDKYFNSSLLLGPAGVIHTYRKLHLFNEEKNWF